MHVICDCFCSLVLHTTQEKFKRISYKLLLQRCTSDPFDTKRARTSETYGGFSNQELFCKLILYKLIPNKLIFISKYREVFSSWSYSFTRLLQFNHSLRAHGISVAIHCPNSKTSLAWRRQEILFTWRRAKKLTPACDSKMFCSIHPTLGIWTATYRPTSQNPMGRVKEDIRDLWMK